MPVSNAPLDKLIASLKAADTVAITDIDPHVLADGLEDLKNRMGHAEHSHLKVMHEARSHADRMTHLEEVTTSLERDRDEFRKQVATATQAPEANKKKIDELDERVRAVEGATGAAPYKKPEPIKPEQREPKTPEHPAYDAPPPKNKPEPFPDPSRSTYDPTNPARSTLGTNPQSSVIEGSGGQAHV